VTTTFRPELVGVAAKHYGISLQNKHSAIHPMLKEDALQFVAEMQASEEATLPADSKEGAEGKKRRRAAA
jgi:hypothetical protein